MTISFTLASSPYVPQKRPFDLLHDRKNWLDKHLRPNTGLRVHHDWHPIPLGWINLHPYRAAEALGLVDLVFMTVASRYQCPILGYHHHSAVPGWLLTKDVTRYPAITSHYAKDMLSDIKWMRKGFRDEPNKFARALLGSGNTSFFMPNDGSGEIHHAHIALDNGDLLTVHVWHWFNK